MQKLFKKDYFFIALVVVLSLVAGRFLLAPGFYTFSDEPHIANLYEMIRAIRGGQLPPRWAPDVSFNFGHPLFNFYYPLPFYLGSLFHLLAGLSLIWSLKLVFLLSFPAAGVAFYFLMRKFFGQIASFSGAVLYTFTPYRAVDLYVRGAVGELWGFVFMPLTALLFINLIKKHTFKNLGLAALGLAGLVLAHNLTPIIFLPFLAIFVGTFAWQEKERFSSLIYCLATGALGLAASAYYWLPAVLEKQFIQKGTPFNPYDHFPFIKQLLFPSWGYGASVWGPGDGLSFQIGVVNLLVVLLAILAFLISGRKWGKQKLSLFFCLLFFFGISVFMMNIRSWPFWQILPLGDYIQFPWRLLMLTTLFSSMILGFSEDLLKKKWGECLPLLLSVVAIVLTFNYFKPAKQVLVDDDYYLRRFFADRTVFGKREVFSKEYLNYSEDYLPLTIWTSKRPESISPKVEADDPRVQISYQEKTPTKFEIDFKHEKGANLIVNSYYFPGWEAWVDGQLVEISPVKPFGQMRIAVPSGEHQIQVKFKETPLRKAADLTSLFSLLGVLGLTFLGERKWIF